MFRESIFGEEYAEMGSSNWYIIGSRYVIEIFCVGKSHMWPLVCHMRYEKKMKVASNGMISNDSEKFKIRRIKVFDVNLPMSHR